MSIRKCPNCNSEIENWSFCFHCGANLKAQTVAKKPDEKVEQSESISDNTLADLADEPQDIEEVKTPSCPNCGKEIGEWDFCFYCGANLKVQTVAEQPDEEVEQSESISNNALAELADEPQDIEEVKTPSCPNCGKEIGEWDFCFYCGANLKAQTVVEQPVEEVEQSKSIFNNTLADLAEEPQDIEEVKTPVCPNCGKEIGEWDFCFHCGANLKAQTVAEQSDEEVEQSESISNNALADLADEPQDIEEVKPPVCPNCGKEIGEWDSCSFCGSNLRSGNTTESQTSIESKQTNTDEQILNQISKEDCLSEQFDSENLSDLDNENDLQNDTPIDNIIVLTDEEGNEVEFEFLDLITYCGKEYVVLLPNDKNADEVVILEFEESSDGAENFSSVENDYTLQVVFQIFKQRAKDEFNFID